MSGTLLAFDFGTKSIGVAVGQRITGTARPLPAIKAQDGTPDWNIIERLLKEWQPDEIIVGLPLNMDGTEQPLTARARKFANRIHGRLNRAAIGRSTKAKLTLPLRLLFSKAISSRNIKAI